MSTFKGIVAEFPRIRIDYFRQQPEHKAPLACFLSHVHSDHLAGLETLRAPFVYCSAATREILLRLEKYHHRINFAKGLLESRNVTYDRSMRRLAKPLPLDTPTTIELSPGNNIRVTLLDANHCVGAVMFLIEGDSKAILYTGDIRAETWWVNSLIQNPVLVPYTLGTRFLDCVYLDTTFATKEEPYRDFSSKAEGIRELLREVSKYPDDTVFYFHSWTFGYENVWIALSAFLGSQIHLDDYRARIYGSLSILEKKQLREVGLNVTADNKFLRESGVDVREAPALCGFKNGHHIHPGCLTSRENVRIHSCERGMGCGVMDRDADAKVVHIIPVVTRANGVDIAELGAGGGKGDLDLKEELETGGAAEVSKLMELCSASMRDNGLLTKVFALLQQALSKGGTLDLEMQLQDHGQDATNGKSLQNLISALSSNASKSQETKEATNRTIKFPYSRHSSYAELCSLVEAFKPMDVFPCTVDESTWCPEISIRNLFGQYCSSNIFCHDVKMMKLYEARLALQTGGKRGRKETQRDTQDSEEEEASPVEPKRTCLKGMSTTNDVCSLSNAVLEGTMDSPTRLGTRQKNPYMVPTLTAPVVGMLETAHRPPTYTATTSTSIGRHSPNLTATVSATASDVPVSSVGTSSTRSQKFSPRRKRSKFTNAQLAYQAAIGNYGLSWSDYGGLVSTRSKADQEEQEL